MKLEKFRVGDAFKWNGETYIAIALSPDPFNVFCLDVERRKLTTFDESEDVELIRNWKLIRSSKEPGKGKKLEELY